MRDVQSQYLSHFQDETGTFLTVHRGIYVILPLKRSLSCHEKIGPG